MSMSTGGGSTNLQNDINVTPMIDVLLVLLIIFMMIVPQLRKSIDLQLPDPNPSVAPVNAKSDQIVLEILPGPQYLINKEAVAGPRLGGRLREIYDPRPDKIIFVKADSNVIYQDVIKAMDIARGSGVKVIGVPPKEAPAGG